MRAKPASPPSIATLFHDVRPTRISHVLDHTTVLAHDRYLHWDQMRHRSPPADLSHEEWWLGTRIARRSAEESIPLYRKTGPAFTLVHATPIRQGLHEIDQRLGVSKGRPGIRDLVLGNGKKYLLGNAIMEEAIRSSQLEGASTTRKRAKEMIRRRQTPQNRSEQMILNNYNAMLRVEELATHDLSEEHVFELHRILVSDTLDEPEKAGQFRVDEDEIIVGLSDYTGEAAHVPPPAGELDDRLRLILAFANGHTPDQWIHPVLRALIVHFMIGYDHPFVDGNGRVARALFYWSMMRQGYDLARYLTVSGILRRSPGKYGRSYLFTETDAGDLTYFVDYHIGVIKRSIKELVQYANSRRAETEELQEILEGVGEFNYRQLRLIRHALRHSGFRYTVQSHAHSHAIARSTARIDLTDLVAAGLLRLTLYGRTFEFVPADDLAEKLKQRHAMRMARKKHQGPTESS